MRPFILKSFNPDILVEMIEMAHMRGIAYLEKEEYEQAEAWVDMYAELGWMEGLDDKGLEVVAEFRFLAQTIRYAIDLMSGRVDALDSYVDFLRENPESSALLSF
ncbi:hypothetical protein [Paenibacillus piscarius]|uniref:hypothetical protein n=1 Tax=Paenibacillus piscarius TaxID=1089681 RepID=UPI001EE8E514|nr:hypothetical protein [Paenibacillus piscarius]